MKHYVTENQMLDDLTEIMDGYVAWIGNTLSIKHLPIDDAPSDTAAPIIVLAAKATDYVTRRQVESFPIARTLRLVRDYAFDGLRPANDQELLDDLIDCQEFVYGLVAIESSPDTQLAPEIIGSSVERVVNLASARHTLDSGFELTIPMMATLAGLDERTVRNLAGKSGDKDLTTYKVDGKAYVRPDLAYEWLVSKKGFTPTRWDFDYRRGGEDFSSPPEFGDFLRERRESLGLSIADVVKGTESFQLNKDAWYKMENGGYFPGLEFTSDLAQVLDVDEKWLTERVMKVFFSKQWETLQATGTAS